MTRFYLLLVLVAVAVDGFLLVRFVRAGPAAPIVDEIPYYHGAKVFAEYRSLKAEVFIEEDVSRVLQGDWYGPGYPVFFGSMRRALGNTDNSFIYTNVLLLAGLVFVVAGFTGVDRQRRSWLVAMVLMASPVIVHLFYFMPVLLDLFWAGLLLAVLLKVADRQQRHEDIRGMLFGYCVLCLVASCFKQTFALFLVGILPFAARRTEALLYSAVVVLGQLAALVYGKYFLAPAYAEGPLALARLLQLDFGAFWTALRTIFIGNIRGLATIVTGTPRLFVVIYVTLLVIPVLTLYRAYAQRNRLLFSLGLIMSATLLVLVSLYSTHWAYFIRITVPILLVSLVAVSQLPWPKCLPIALAVSFALNLPFTVRNVIREQDQKVQLSERVAANREIFSPLSRNIEGSGIITVLYDQEFYRPYDISAFILSLPIANANGQQIRYTVNYRGPTFALHHKLKVDYILALTPQELAQTRLVDRTGAFALYKVLDAGS